MVYTYGAKKATGVDVDTLRDDIARVNWKRWRIMGGFDEHVLFGCSRNMNCWQ